MEAVIRCWPAVKGETIPPEIYGHFSEHLGRCIYEGIWVGNSGNIPNQNGIRLDVLAALKQLRVPVIRWPGGCFADDYHWRDGIGPIESRPQTVNLWWKQVEPNSFGTDEFLQFCEVVGAAPYICANLGSGSPREARDWVEYCNFTGDSTLAQLRAANGRKPPYQVKRWGIGNENWGCGGNFTGRDYAKEYMRFATYMRAISPEIELLACGASFGDYRNSVQNAWNREVCDELRRVDLVNHITLHRHFSRGQGESFSDAEYYALFADALSMERDIALTDAVLRDCFPDRTVGIAVDEWGVWHPEAVPENGLEQPNTLRDALMAATVLHVFNQWAQRVSMANLAQTVNVLQCLAVTDRNKMFLTPTYYVFDMMRLHGGAKQILFQTESPTYEARPVGFDKKQPVPYLDVSASLSGKKVHLTVVNKSLTEAIEAKIEVREAVIASVSGKMLHGEQPGETNSFKSPSRIASRRIRPTLSNEQPVQTFPPRSFTALTITLE